MVVLASRDKPFAYTAKESPRRGIILKDYDEEIDAAYKAVDESTHTDIPIPSGTHETGGWSLDESRSYVRQVVQAVMKDASKMSDEDDIFSFGCDRHVYIYYGGSIPIDRILVFRQPIFATLYFMAYGKRSQLRTSAKFQQILCTKIQL